MSATVGLLLILWRTVEYWQARVPRTQFPACEQIVDRKWATAEQLSDKSLGSSMLYSCANSPKQETTLLMISDLHVQRRLTMGRRYVA